MSGYDCMQFLSVNYMYVRAILSDNRTHDIIADFLDSTVFRRVYVFRKVIWVFKREYMLRNVIYVLEGDRKHYLIIYVSV